jgi:predicted O-methyltransferase YrrM
MAGRGLARLETFRRSLRDKFLNVVEEVVDRYNQEQLDTLRVEFGQLRAELQLNREQLSRAIAEFEHRTRRDISAAGDRAAVWSSAEFARMQMPTAVAFSDLRETLEYGLKIAPADGLALEFGVWSGSTLRIIASARGGTGGVYGFDSFEGLPESWRTGFPAGMFSAEGLPDVPGAELVVGLFSDTLPAFLAEHDEPAAFVHVDCDLYSSTVTVLEHIGPRLRPGTVIVFDEFFNYPGWQEHEYRAWTEYVERSGVRFSYEGYTHDHEQVVVRVTGV